MRSVADVVIIGGGAIGTSIAFNLTALGIPNVVLVERDELSAGATSRSGALIRMHYTDAPEARLAVAALPWFEQWSDRVGGSCGFVRTGFVQLVTAPDVARLRENVAVLKGLGVETSVLGEAELASLNSGLAVAEGDAGAYEPRSGYADPIATTQTLAAAAVRSGAEIAAHTAARKLLTSGDRITGVETDMGNIAAPIVILANGAWASSLTKPLGIDLPIQAISAQIAIVSRPRSLHGLAGHLTMIDRRTGIYARPNGESETLIGISQSALRINSPDEAHVTDTFPEQALTKLALSIPEFTGQRVIGSRAGPLDVTPDYAAIIGAVPQLEGLILAVGMSGSGFKKAPAIGACIAELIVEGRARTASIDEFAPTRFAEGKLIARNDYVVGGAGAGPALIH